MVCKRGHFGASELRGSDRFDYKECAKPVEALTLSFHLLYLMVKRKTQRSQIKSQRWFTTPTLGAFDIFPVGETKYP